MVVYFRSVFHFLKKKCIFINKDRNFFFPSGCLNFCTRKEAVCFVQWSSFLEMIIHSLIFDTPHNPEISRHDIPGHSIPMGMWHVSFQGQEHQDWTLLEFCCPVVISASVTHILAPFPKMSPFSSGPAASTRNPFLSQSETEYQTVEKYNRKKFLSPPSFRIKYLQWLTETFSNWS